MPPPSSSHLMIRNVQAGHRVCLLAHQNARPSERLGRPSTSSSRALAAQEIYLIYLMPYVKFDWLTS
jgi:hypothetical protein